jgi:hypothetical protein
MLKEVRENGETRELNVKHYIRRIVLFAAQINRSLFSDNRYMPIYYLICLVFFSIATADSISSSSEVLALAGFPLHKIGQLDQGEIITHEIPETSDKELAMSVAIYMAVPLEKVIDYMRNVNLLAIDSDVTAYGSLPRNANSNDFRGFAFSPKQMEEVTDLLNTGESERFNLSSQEISGFSALHASLTNADEKNLAKNVTQKYREILQQRWQAYKNNGLKGIADYSREEGATSPAAELSNSVENCKVLNRYFPELFYSWINYPASLPSGVEEYFYWINRTVENRPTAILAHSILQTTSTGALIVGRQFYVGHSYNSSHLCVGMLPYRDGTLVYYVESTSTDQVVGVASGLRHIIGREQLKDQMIRHLEKLSKTFEIAAKAD